MPEIVGKFRMVSTHMSPVDASIAHLSHLAKTSTAKRILTSRFHFTKSEANESAPVMGAHVEQAVEFYRASQIANARVKPVLQYYAYLNLAVASIIAYRSVNWRNYRSHGVRDRTASITRLTLSSEVVEVTKGTVPLFHSVLSDDSLLKRTFRLWHLFASFPIVSLELEDAFGYKPYRVSVEDNLTEVSLPGKNFLNSELRFSCWRTEGHQPVNVSFPRKRVERAIPMLATDYKFGGSGSTSTTYTSLKTWPVSARSDAEEWHRKVCFKAINWRAGVSREQSGIYHWMTVSRAPILPVMSGTLLLSFALASMARYRPGVVAKYEEDRLYLLIDVFVNESGGLLIPAFRNLLYREEMVFSSI